MITVTTQIDKTLVSEIKKIAEEKEWSMMQVIRKLIVLAFQHGLDKKL